VPLLWRTRGIPHKLLNAKPENVERELKIIAQAGPGGASTRSLTNMAGRGTDIILGGNSDYRPAPQTARCAASAPPGASGGGPPSPVPLPREAAGGGFGSACPSGLAQPPASRGAIGALYPAPHRRHRTIPGELQVETVKAWASALPPVLTLRRQHRPGGEKAPRRARDPEPAPADAPGRGPDTMACPRGGGTGAQGPGGLHVIGTERHESRRVTTSCVAAPPQGNPGSNPASLPLAVKTTSCASFGGIGWPV